MDHQGLNHLHYYVPMGTSNHASSLQHCSDVRFCVLRLKDESMKDTRGERE